MKYLPIDSYGPCVNNKKMPNQIDGFHHIDSDANKKFLRKYKFQLALENAVCDDYMTEKIFRPLEIGSVPIYYGSPKARDLMPTNHSLIMVTDFLSPQDLAKFILQLNDDDERYEEYLKHRRIGVTNPTLLKIKEQQPWSLPHAGHKPNWGSFMFQGFACYVCDKVRERNTRMLQHLKDPSIPLMPHRTGTNSHMGCPAPFPMVKGGRPKQPYPMFEEGLVEARAITLMLQSNESDTKLFQKKYLKRRTDKYPYFR